ncbi:MAG TPA: hypothetical protein VME21_13245 [Steroidobacteraceae bacterium]|nr:hypothetical protein [Steroidobacteraceae bacterium]
MPLSRWLARTQGLPGAPGVRGLQVDAEEWRQLARDVAGAGGRLLALWVAPQALSAACGNLVCAAYLTSGALLAVRLPLPAASVYPGLAELFPCALRLQRAAADLSGVCASDPDQRPWLSGEPYDFVRVQGDGVHEIAVGPVHAGIIEPGHFRFSVVGEKVLRLEEHLGYVHKGIGRLFRGRSLLEGQVLAARVSGDSAVAFGWAYCQALEGMAGASPPPRAAFLRALMLELERIANHLGDLGALGNDAGFAFGLAQFSRLKELLLRATHAAFGQRYLLDALVPGGVRRDLTPQAIEAIRAQLPSLEQQLAILRAIYEEHAGLRDRFTGTGALSAALAARLGVLGLVGRASAQPLDLRIDLPCSPYDALPPRRMLQSAGDVAARVTLRFDELAESLSLVRRLLAQLPSGASRIELGAVPPGACGVGLIEGWRGPVLVALEAGPEGRIASCHAHDPSWQSWPALEHAIIGNIVPDFPLINKSFNLSYSGVDL